MNKSSMPGGSSIKQRGAGVLLTVRVQPKASRKAVRIEPGGFIRVSVTEPPEDGAANQAVLKLLADVLGVPKRAVTLHSGLKSRNKTVLVDDVTAQSVLEKLAAIPGSDTQQ